MLGDDEDVFDSVTWESPVENAYANEHATPGFRQSTSDSHEGPHDPKWEGYLITSVKDPLKELAETKDAYVSYLVSAKVSFLCVTIGSSMAHGSLLSRPISLYSLIPAPHRAGDFRTLSSSENIW